MKRTYQFIWLHSISFEQYCWLEFDNMHNAITKIWFHHNCFQYFEDMLNSILFRLNLHHYIVYTTFDMSDTRLMSYMFFVLFTSNHKLLFRFWLPKENEFGDHMHIIFCHEYSGNDIWCTIVCNYLDELKQLLFSNRENIQSVYRKRQILYPQGDKYEILMKDILWLASLWEEFQNSIVNLTLKNGEPNYMTAETYTQNTDFNLWKEKLWNNRKIEENTTYNKIQSLKVTKKFKYQ